MAKASEATRVTACAELHSAVAAAISKALEQGLSVDAIRDLLAHIVTVLESE